MAIYLPIKMYMHMNSVWTMAGAWVMLEAKAKEVQTPLSPVMEQSYPPPLAAIRVGNSPLTQKLLAVMGEGVLDGINIY